MVFVDSAFDRSCLRVEFPPSRCSKGRCTTTAPRQLQHEGFDWSQTRVPHAALHTAGHACYSWEFTLTDSKEWPVLGLYALSEMLQLCHKGITEWTVLK